MDYYAPLETGSGHIVSGDSIFSATGITNGDLVRGVKKNNNKFMTETLVTHKSQNLVKKIEKFTVIKWNQYQVWLGKLSLFLSD